MNMFPGSHPGYEAALHALRDELSAVKAEVRETAAQLLEAVDLPSSTDKQLALQAAALRLCRLAITP